MRKSCGFKLYNNIQSAKPFLLQGPSLSKTIFEGPQRDFCSDNAAYFQTFLFINARGGY